MTVIRMETTRKVSQPDRHGEPWSPDEDGTLRYLAQRGESLEYIAQVCHRTPGAIKFRLETLNSPIELVKPMQRKAEKDKTDFRRSSRPSKTFTNRFRNKCTVCTELIPVGADAHFVAPDKIAHSDCY